jgi:hypothetical protein
VLDRYRNRMDDPAARPADARPLESVLLMHPLLGLGPATPQQ